MNIAGTASSASAWLMPVTGPAAPAVELPATPGELLVGRHESCNVRLPADNVSRAQARLNFDGQRWRIADLKSRWGTFVNGIKVSPDGDVPLGDGDLLRITPWTFRFVASPAGKSGLLEGAIESVDDALETCSLVNSLAADRLPTLGDELLALLLASAAGIHAAPDEKALAHMVLEKACQGSGLPNAAVLKPAGTDGRFQVMASRSANASQSLAYSRSLLAAASGGEVAELSSDSQPVDISQSIVSMGVRSALCVPILLGQTVAAYLYLDSRGQENTALRLPLRPNAAAFCLALGRMAGLALANLKRIEMERRAAGIEADLAAAAAAQQWILPRRHGNAGPFVWTGESRPGAQVGGDFYDVIPLANDRLALAIGDVSGHGIAASVLMTATAGFLHAALQETNDVGAAVTRLNRFICPRRPMDKFVTMWVGIFDPRQGIVHYVDAGHGYVLLGEQSGPMKCLGLGGQFPLGVEEECIYRAASTGLPASGRALLISDGLVEQFGSDADPCGPASPFRLDGVEQIMAKATVDSDAIADLFDAVISHAGRPSLSDDATAVLVKWVITSPPHTPSQTPRTS